MKNVLAILAFVIFVAFLAVLLIHVPRLDLTLIIGLTVLLAGWDLYQGLKGNRG